MHCRVENNDEPTMKSSRSIIYVLFVALLVPLITSISLISTPTRAQDSSPTPPTPTPRPIPAYNSKADDGGFNAQYCDFDNTLSVEDQNAAVQAMYDAVDGNDWVLAGRRARRLYRKCPMKAQFYLLYVVYLP